MSIRRFAWAVGGGGAAAVVAFAVVISASAAATATSAVPRVANVDIAVAYGRLHRAGFRVTYVHSFSAGSFNCLPTIASESPYAGRPAMKGTVVTLRAKPPSCGVSSPAVPTGKLPSAKVPNFVSESVTAGVAWADSHKLYWEAKLPPLRAGARATLLDNYRVIDQRPSPGSNLTLGIAKGGGTQGSFLPTPLTLRGKPAKRR